MTDKKVSELDAITAVDDADFMPIVDDSETTGKNKKVTVGQLKTHIAAASSGVSGTMTGHVVPDANSQHDLGAAEFKIRHLYLSNNSLYMGPETELEELKLAKIKTEAGADGFHKMKITSDVLVEADVGDDTPRGFLLKSPNGTVFRLTVSDAGEVTGTQV